MDLEEAAHGAVVMMRRLLEALGEARASCGDALTDVTTFAQRLDTEREQLAESLTGLERGLADLGGTVSREMSEVETETAVLTMAAAGIGRHEPLGPIAANVPGTGPNAALALDTESSALRQLAQAVDGMGPDLERVVAAAEAAGQAALSRADALEDAMRQVVDDAEQLVGIDHASFLVGLADASVAHAGRVEALLSKACGALLDDRQQDVERKRRLVADLFDRVFRDMGAHCDALAAEVPQACADRVAEVVDDVATWAAALESGLLDLESSVSDAGTALDATLPDRLLTTAEGARAAADGVVAVRETWRGRGFGR